MKNKLFPTFTILLCILSLNAYSQVTISNEKTYGGAMTDEILRLMPSTNLSKIIGLGGSSSSNGDLPGNNGLKDAWLLKHNQLSLSLNYGGANDDSFRDGIFDANNIIVAGSSSSTMPGCTAMFDRNVYLAKLDTSGSTTSQVCIGGSLDDDGIKFIYNPAGNFSVLLANIKSTDGDLTGLTHRGLTDVGVFVLDASFNINSKFLFGSSGIDLVTDGYIDGNNLVILGETDGNDYDFAATTPLGGDDIFVRTYDLNTWNVTATYRFGGNDTDHGSRIFACNGVPGEYFIVGNTHSTNFGNCNGKAGANGIVMKGGLQNNPLWVTCLAGNDQDIVVSGTLMANSTCNDATPLYVSGHTNSNDGNFNILGPGNWDAFIAKIDKQVGTFLEVLKYGGTNVEFNNDIISPNPGVIITANQTNSNDGDIASGNQGLYDAWIAEFTVATSVSELQNELPEVLLSPNPAVNEITVSCSKFDFWDYKIFNLAGKEILSGNVNASEFVIPITTIDQGIYFMQLVSDEFAVSKKLIIAGK